MKKKRWIILIFVIIIIWAWTTYFLFIKEPWKSKTKSECQDFIDECYKQNFEFFAWGWHAFIVYPDWSTSLDYKANCPQDCSRYTEERWYFKDKVKQKEYYDNKIKECKKEYEKCLKDTTWLKALRCHDCNKYWDPIYLWN